MDWTVDGCKRFMWSNHIFHCAKQIAGCKYGDSRLKACFAPILPSCWGQYYGLGDAFWGHCRSPMIIVEKRLNTQGYLTVIADQVYPIMLMVYSDPQPPVHGSNSAGPPKEH
ncbi:hypothetical protein TNCV_462141 [Trichonephila clavipes]|uniref:Uncharacterized protein n=1 Tax=Trichonephila clavipes TaxID=2585209 RepID=A0A8X6UYJ5_TRICX|nr:hypothetical protein TNCV_462141 [Trichonephila clavipes]